MASLPKNIRKSVEQAIPSKKQRTFEAVVEYAAGQAIQCQYPSTLNRLVQHLEVESHKDLLVKAAQKPDLRLLEILLPKVPKEPSLLKMVFLAAVDAGLPDHVAFLLDKYQPDGYKKALALAEKGSEMYKGKSWTKERRYREITALLEKKKAVLEKH